MEHLEYSFNTSDGLTLFAQSWLPDQEKRGLVLLNHGLGEHSGRYAHLGEMLAEAGYITSAFDLRGHGKSGGRRGHSPSFEAFMDDIDLFINENNTQFPAIPQFLYGHSLGALFILNYAARRSTSFKGLIATGPALRNELEQQKGKVALIKILYKIFPTLSLSTGLDAYQLSRDEAIVEAYINDPLVHDRASLSMAKYSLEAINWVFNHVQDIHAPVLMMQGSLDKICFLDSTRDFAERLPGEVTLKVWDGFYHEIHNEPGWENVIQYMIAWLDNQIG